MTGFSQIILHAGLSKTGTTSIQDNCSTHREFLRERGVHYPLFRFGKHCFRNHSIPLTVAVCAAPGQYGLGLRRRFGDDVPQMKAACRAQFDALLRDAPGETLVLSTELLESWCDEDLQALRQRLLQGTDSLRVIAYIRSPQSALESTLQERAKAGAMPAPADIVGRVRDKYLRLERNFEWALECVDFHRAQEAPGGLVGSFFSLAGIRPAETSGLDYRVSNRRLSVEAFRLLSAVNRQFPRREQHRHGVTRFAGDLDLLAELPGQPFSLRDYPDPDLRAQVLEETLWLEQQLGYSFPQEPTAPPAILWREETVRALEPLLQRIDDQQIRTCIADFLCAEGRVLQAAGREEAPRLLSLAGGHAA